MSTKSDTEGLVTTQPTKRLSLRREAVRKMGVRSGLKTGGGSSPVIKSTGIHGPVSACRDCTATINHCTNGVTYIAAP